MSASRDTTVYTQCARDLTSAPRAAPCYVKWRVKKNKNKSSAKERRARSNMMLNTGEIVLQRLTKSQSNNVECRMLIVIVG